MEEQQRASYHTELSIREPTGLVLGVFDEITIQRKIYQREFAPNCEFRRADDPDGQWAQLPEHAAFADAFWVAGISTEAAETRRVARFSWGRSNASASASVGRRSIVREADAPRPAAAPAAAPRAEDSTAVYHRKD